MTGCELGGAVKNVIAPVAAGIGMHAAFTCLKPRRLLTFSGLALGTYVAFADLPPVPFGPPSPSTR
ncbi:hypothetical protein ACH4F6_30645 [Streptomyces sp. NPDC017936]|uniref:hypothetical protein n=1 Tax=Streptomyces sp. NPDC017936 TaxID=3365016 RepID=UPI0037B005F4